MALGDYPPEYNPRVHGPYDPSRYYGKPDTPFSELRLTEVSSWLMRRQKSPRAFAGLCSRAFWRWQMKYVQPKYAGITPLVQFAVASSLFFYYLNYGKLKHERKYKYH
ncbi:putative ATP synthase subunit f, mitochondrial [Dermacentor silvarum]|uniref:putative ATP synthase subunit f, mitochondrial n=1 Tax=Dermacentor silvarum TaxID=543639 RepID=UPI0018996B6F|nr:putative ATP synthase subunit f, mitochondrial [Dermacentor silvarum]